MAAPQVKFYGCFDGGVGLRQKLLASGPVAVWPLSDLYGGPDGGEIEELVADRVGHGDNVGRGDPGLLPEYGCATGFLAAGLRYIEVDHVSAFSGSTSVAFGTMFLLGDTGITQNIVVKDAVFELLITSSDVLELSVILGGATTTVSYPIADTADWMAHPRFLIGRYDGTTLQLLEIRTDEYATPSYAEAVLADGPFGYWRLGEAVGTQAFDSSGNGRHGTFAGVTLGVSGALADGNLAAEWGDDDAHRVSNTTSLVGITGAVTIEGWINTDTNTNPNQHRMWFSSSDNASYCSLQNPTNATPMVSLRIGGTQRTLASAITPTIGQWYHIVATWTDGDFIRLYINGALAATSAATYTGALSLGSGTFYFGKYAGDALRAFDGKIDDVALYDRALSSTEIAEHYALRTAATGQVTTLATRGASGAVATNTNNIFIGRRSAALDYLSGRLQYAALWVNDTPTDADLADFATSLVWTEFTEDVKASAGFEARWGIPESSPAARCGVPGILQFTLRNGRTNAARTRGYYTLGHANVRSGFALGMMMRLDLIDPAAPSAPSQRFIGRLIAAPATTGRYDQTVACTVTDYFDELQRAQLPPMPIVANQTYATTIAKIITALAVKPHDIAGSAEGSTYPYGLDQTQDEESSTLDELERLVVSEWGGLYMRGGGSLQRDDRQARQLVTTPAWTFDNAMHGLDMDRNTREEIITQVQIAVYPRSESAGSSEVIFTLGAPLKFEPGQTHILQAPYTDPDNPTARIGLIDGTGASVLTVNTAEDGSGTVTALTGTVTYGANSAKAFLTNPHAFAVWLTGLTLTGKTVSTYHAHNANAESTDSLRGRVGDNVFRVEQPYSHDSTAAAHLATYLLAALQAERPSAHRLTLRGTAAADATVIDCIVNVECGDLIHVTEDMSGVDDGYFVNGITLRGSKGRHGTEVVADLTLARRELTTWVLGVAGFSELGETTVIGY